MSPRSHTYSPTVWRSFFQRCGIERPRRPKLESVVSSHYRCRTRSWFRYSTDPLAALWQIVVYQWNRNSCHHTISQAEHTFTVDHSMAVAAHILSWYLVLHSSPLEDAPASPNADCNWYVETPPRGMCSSRCPSEQGQKALTRRPRHLRRDDRPRVRQLRLSTTPTHLCRRMLRWRCEHNRSQLCKPQSPMRYTAPVLTQSASESSEVS